MAKILDTWGERNTWIEIQHLFHNKKNPKILDIACGTGKVMKILENNLKIKNIHGCDISDFLIEKAKQKEFKTTSLEFVMQQTYLTKMMNLIITIQLDHWNISPKMELLNF